MQVLFAIKRTSLLLKKELDPKRTARLLRHALHLLQALFFWALSFSSAAQSSSQYEADARAQRIFEARLYLNDLVRLQRISYAVMRGGSAYCVHDQAYSAGIPPLAINDLPPDLRDGYRDSLGAQTSSSAGFLVVQIDSPYRVAGIRDGDILLSLSDSATNKALLPTWSLNRPSSTLVLNEPLTASVSTDGKARTVKVRPQLICAIEPKLSRQDNLVVRLADGILTLSTGLLRFVRNDDELALLLSHELAHHILAVKSTTTARVRARKNSVLETERTADYLAVYIASAAGYDVERAQDVWLRIASNPPSLSRNGMAHQHPLTPARSAWQREYRAEIRRKTVEGKTLAPYRKRLPPNIDPTLLATDEDPLPAAPEASSGPDPRLVRVADLPFVTNDGRSGYQRFLNTPLRPRAFAINSVGGWAYRSGGDAVSDALTSCNTPAAPCYLYAVDERVVWNPETAEDMPQVLSPDKASDPRLHRVADVPLIDAEGRVGYERFLGLNIRPRAFAIGPNGTGGAAWTYRSGPNASADALVQCSMRLRGRPCYLYAVDDEVVWKLDNAPHIPAANTSDNDNGGLRRKPSATGFADIKDIETVPLLNDQKANYRAFLEKPAPRAFVISQEGFGRYWLGAAAMENALAYCERLSEPCWLYAVDEDVVWHVDKNKRISRRAQLPKQADEAQFLK